MISAMIVMTILGCDDSVSQCRYVSSVSGTWTTIEKCDAESQKQLPKFTNSNYPVIVAVCETSGTATADARAHEAPAAGTLAASETAAVETPGPETAAAETAPTPDADAQNPPGLPRRTLALIGGVLPDGTKLRQAVTWPIHSIGDGYSWIARKLTN